VIDRVLRFAADNTEIDAHEWERGRYCPTPTIIEAALALCRKRKDTSAKEAFRK